MQLLLQLAVGLAFICAIQAHELKKYFKDQKNPWEDEQKPAVEWPHYPYPDPFAKYDWHDKYHMPSGDPSMPPMPKPLPTDPWPMPKPWTADPWAKPWVSDPWPKPWDPTKPANTDKPILTFEGKLNLYGGQGQKYDSPMYNMLKKLY